MFRRLRSAPRKLIAFRVFAFAVGLLFVLATTSTIQTVRSALEVVAWVGETIRTISGTTPTFKKQEDQHG